MADGSRLHAVVPPVAVDGPIIAVRRFTEAVPDLEALVAANGVRKEGAELLASAVTERRNLLITGGTGSGKTTLLNVLSKEIDPSDRTVTVEDAAELKLSGHVVRLEARPPNAEGAGEVTLRTLLRHALRLRPDRIIIGEVRGPEAIDMIQAIAVLGPSPSRRTVPMTQLGDHAAIPPSYPNQTGGSGLGSNWSPRVGWDEGKGVQICESGLQRFSRLRWW